jgi:hypothetical protein
MAKLNETIDVNDLPVSERNFDPLPPGWYRVTITEADYKPTSKSTKEAPASMVKVRYDVMGPTCQGRVVFGNFNNRHPKPEVERIGRQQFGELLRAIGLAKCDDTDQLVGRSCDIKLTIREASGGYDASNDVKAWKAIEGGAMPGPSTTVAPAKAASSAAAPPWAKK